MSGTELLVKEIWRQRVRLARPRADDAGVEHAVKSILRDPKGAYAKEIQETAERAEQQHWHRMTAPQPEGEKQQ